MSDPRCATCGHPRSNHPYRHTFAGPSLEDEVKDLEAKLAKAVKLIDLAVEMARWDRAPKLRDDMIDFTTEIKGENQDGQ